MATITQDTTMYPYTTVANKYGKTWHLPTCPTLRQAKYARASKVSMAEYAKIQNYEGRYYRSGDRECQICLGEKKVAQPTFSKREAKALFDKAHKAGVEAATGTTPTSMIVQQHKNMLDDNSPVVKQYHVSEGVCGFAWVTIRPATSSIAHHAKAMLDARTGYYGGMEIWVSQYGQSYERKLAYAHAFASALRDAGVDARSDGRLD